MNIEQQQVIDKFLLKPAMISNYLVLHRNLKKPLKLLVDIKDYIQNHEDQYGIMQDLQRMNSLYMSQQKKRSKKKSNVDLVKQRLQEFCRTQGATLSDNPTYPEMVEFVLDQQEP